MIPRALLFVPGDRPERFAKAAESGADAIILDLEDSVAAARRGVAREAIAAYLAGAKPLRKPFQFVRINPLSTPEALLDLAAVMPGAPDGIMLPKAEGAADIAKLDHFLSAFEAASSLTDGSTAILPISTETPRSLFSLDSYRGASARLFGLTWGAEDLTAAIGAETNRGSDGALTDLPRLARSLCLAGAASAELPAFETVFTAFKDQAGLEAYATAGRREGFAGMLAIHPAQVATINVVFTPSEAELQRARRIVQAFAENPDLGVIAIDGEMIDRPHLKQALRAVSR